MTTVDTVNTETISQLINKVQSEQNLFFVILAVSAMVLMPVVLGFRSKYKQAETQREKTIIEAFTENAVVMSGLRTAIEGLNVIIGKTEINIGKIGERIDTMGDTLAATNALIDSVSEKANILIADSQEVKNEIKETYKTLAMKVEI